MIASLMMYGHPALDAALARYWTGIRAALHARGIPAPTVLSRSGDPWRIWRAPDLVLSQTCGMPYRTRLHGRVQLVGTPDYGLPGCPPGYYRSTVVVRTDDARRDLAKFTGATFAYNDAFSQSGVAALYTHLAARGWWFRKTLCSGSHPASARMVATGQADIAALDAQTWRLLQRYDPVAGALRVLAVTEPTPGLPYITGPDVDAGAVFDAVTDAIAGLGLADRETLDLRGLVRIPAAPYRAVPTPPEGLVA